MQQRIFYGDLDVQEVAQVLLAEFNRGNFRAQAFGNAEGMAIQIATRPEAGSGGQTALTLYLRPTTQGMLAQMGEQAWIGIAASLGQTALLLLRNPLALLTRLDDLAQDLESLQLQEKVWQTIEAVAQASGAATRLEQTRRICEYCGVPNPLTELTCLACGAPLGETSTESAEK